MENQEMKYEKAVCELEEIVDKMDRPTVRTTEACQGFGETLQGQTHQDRRGNQKAAE